MRRWPLLLAIVLATPCFAAPEVYSWTDADGVAHFSDSPPPKGTPFKILDVRVSNPAPAETVLDSDADATSTPAAGKPADSASTVKDTPENRAKLCAQLDENIALLSSNRPLTASADSTQPLSNQQRASRLAKAQAQEKEYCQAN